MRLAIALLAILGFSSAASAALNLEALRLDVNPSVVDPAGTATLILTYRPEGSPATLRDVRVEVEINSSPVTRAAYRIREVVVPQGTREFHMPMDFAKLALRPGTYTISATIDGNDAFRETNERDNEARTTLVLRSASSATAPTTRAPTTRAPGSQSVTPSSVRVVSQTTCSAFEREWAAPAEIGSHPGYGQAAVVLAFDHPMQLTRSGERVRRASLRLVGETVGRPFSELGPMQVTISTRGNSSRCASLSDTRLSQGSFDGDVEIDLSRAMRDAETLTLDCARELHVVLAFPEARTAPAEGSLIRLQPRGATLDVEVGR